MSSRALRRALCTVPVAALLAVAGCGTTPQSGADGSPSGTASSPAATAQPRDTRIPVAKAGGTCKLLSYQKVEAALAVDFDVAAAGKGGNSCVLQVYGHEYPDLSLASSPTKADPKVFADKIAPDGAESVKGLGLAAYRVALAAEGKAGPSAEVGWLVKGKIYVLRYTFEKGASTGQATATAPKLIALAKQLKAS
ncbi:MAG: hypothetical protein ACRDT4_17205 [Micromonosporaceae bacterium]